MKSKIPKPKKWGRSREVLKDSYYSRNRKKMLENATAWNRANAERVKENNRIRYQKDKVKIDTGEND